MVLVTSVGFDDFKEIGDPVSMATIFQDQAADELVFVDIDASRLGRQTLLLDIIEKATSRIFMPITVGGGVRSGDDFRLLLLAGADKVSINSEAVRNKNLITEASRRFGAQCVVVSIDYRIDRNNKAMVWTHGGTQNTEKNAIEWACEAQCLGAGEILLTSIDRDGSRKGLDIGTLKEVTGKLTIPVIASGGCGSTAHFTEGYRDGGADAVSAGTFFCFKDENLMQTRSQISNAGIPIRIHS